MKPTPAQIEAADFVLCYKGVPNEWRVKPEDLTAAAEAASSSVKQQQLIIAWDALGAIVQNSSDLSHTIARHALEEMNNLNIAAWKDK